MIKRLFFILLLINGGLLFAQDYYSYAFNLEEQPVLNPIQLLADGERAYVTSLNSDESSSSMIMKIDLHSLNYDYIKIDSFHISRKGLQMINENLFVFGNTNHDYEKVRLVELNENLLIDTLYDYSTSSPDNGVTCFTSDNLNSYGVSVDKFNEGTHQETHIKKIDQNGNVLWSNNYGIDEKFTFTYEVANSYDDHLLFGANLVTLNPISRRSRLYKIDTLGNVIWKYTDEEISDSSFAKQFIAPLKNNQTVMITRLDKRNDQEYIINDWFPLPSKMSWIDQNGSLVRDTVINSPFLNQLIIKDVIDGKGDYFFAGGNWIDPITDNNYVWLLKIGYNGTIIWNRRYRAPHFEHLQSQYFKDFAELDNGDLLILGMIPDFGKSQIWLLRINEHGCLGDEDCGDVPFTTSIEAILPASKLNISIYPNPVQDVLQLDNPYNVGIDNLEIYDISGNRILQKNMDLSNLNIDVSVWSPGIYLVHLIVDGFRQIHKFIKL